MPKAWQKGLKHSIPRLNRVIKSAAENGERDMLRLPEMASTSPNGFDFSKFEQHFQKSYLTSAQQGPLQRRLELLESFFIPDDSAPRWTFETIYGVLLWMKDYLCSHFATEVILRHTSNITISVAEA